MRNDQKKKISIFHRRLGAVDSTDIIESSVFDGLPQLIISHRLDTKAIDLRPMLVTFENNVSTKLCQHRTLLP